MFVFKIGFIIIFVIVQCDGSKKPVLSFHTKIVTLPTLYSTLSRKDTMQFVAQGLRAQIQI